MTGQSLPTYHSTTKGDVSPEVNISGDCQMIQVDDFWHAIEAFLKVLNLHITFYRWDLDVRNLDALTVLK